MQRKAASTTTATTAAAARPAARVVKSPSSRGRRRRPNQTFPKIFVAVLTLLCCGVLYGIYRAATEPRTTRISAITANDLHAIHDLLTAGSAAVFVEDDDERLNVKEAALKFAELLAKIHPVQECRAALKEARPEKDDFATELDPQVAVAARVSWSCLPAQFSADSFRRAVAFEPWRAGNETLEREARRPAMVERRALGACRSTTWDRTCSFWASLHTLAARADGLGLSFELVEAVTPLIAGGATQCAACTHHFRLLHEATLPPALRGAAKMGYCANVQCSRAQQHMTPLAECVMRDKHCDTEQLRDERTDIFAFRDYLQDARKTRVLSAFDLYVVMHNMVTDSMVTSEPKRFYCAGTARKQLPGWVDQPPPGALPPSPLPGIGHHRLLRC